MPQAAYIFVSHNIHDAVWRRAFVAALRATGANIWCDEDNLGYGQLMIEIERELRARPIFIVILSPTAITSPWVQREFNAAIDLADHDAQRIILPVVAEHCDIPSLWRGYRRICGANDSGVAATDAATRVIHALALAPASAITAPIPAAAESKAETLERSRSLIAQKRYTEALAAIDHLLTFDPHYVAAWASRGAALNSSGRYTDALAAYDHALTLDPQNAIVWANKSVTLNGLHRYTDALVAIERALAIKPKNAMTWNTKGVALNGLQRYQEALEATERALTLDKYYAIAWNTKAVTLHKLKNNDEAVKAFDRALELDPKNFNAWDSKGYVLDELQRYEEALVAYTHALAIDAQSATTWNNRGLTHRHLQRYDEALADYNRALAINSRNVSAWNNKIAVLDIQGRHTEARAAERERDAALRAR